MTNDQRNFMRFPVHLKARYLNNRRWNDCSVVNVSREGMEISFSATKRIDAGNTVDTEVQVPSRKEPIKVAGKIIWLKQQKGNATTHSKAGIKLTKIASTDKWDLLDRAYDNWYGKQLKNVEQTPRQTNH